MTTDVLFVESQGIILENAKLRSNRTAVATLIFPPKRLVTNHSLKQKSKQNIFKGTEMTNFIILSRDCFDDDRQFSLQLLMMTTRLAEIRRPRASGRKKRGGRGHFSRTQTQSLFPVRRSLEIISRLPPICARSPARQKRNNQNLISRAGKILSQPPLLKSIPVFTGRCSMTGITAPSIEGKEQLRIKQCLGLNYS